VDTGSREENASKQKDSARISPSIFNRRLAAAHFTGHFIA
jgi:hypothetical protein